MVHENMPEKTFWNGATLYRVLSVWTTIKVKLQTNQCNTNTGKPGLRKMRIHCHYRVVLNNNSIIHSLTGETLSVYLSTENTILVQWILTLFKTESNGFPIQVNAYYSFQYLVRRWKERTTLNI